MIRVKTIHIEEFRGIRDLFIDFGAKNFGICGPNGSGKSGVVDALEFCITGNVTRLSGQGTVGLSVKKHVPHVDQRNHPERAKVTITADIPSLCKSVKIQRSVKNLRNVDITPSNAEVKGVIEQLGTHPEFALSRREIIKYIITPPGKRSEDVQTLLRLEHIEKLRKNLKTFCNNHKRDCEKAEFARSQAESDLKSALKIDKLEPALILKTINEKRKLLRLKVITVLTKDTSFKTGITTSEGASKKQELCKVEALATLTALQSRIKDGEPSAITKSRELAKITLEKFKDDKKALTLARQYGFIKTGLDLITEDACPLCDTEWKEDELRKHLYKKLLSAEEIEQLMAQLNDPMNVVLQSQSERIQAIERVIQYSQSLKPSVEHTELMDYLTELKKTKTTLNDFLEEHSDIEPALQAISASWWSLKTDQQTRIDECNVAVNALPDTSIEDEARQNLIVAQDRYERLLSATKTTKELKAKKKVAQKILDHYNTSCIDVLEGIYAKVTKDFTNYYRKINDEDENKFVGKLISTPAKLSFDVDFYGRGLFPPGAYHSEGHQDSMGLCLYLALMKHTLGDKFTFAVLDDVLMSVDAGHRRDVCRLLKSEFPDTQFILTTHDRVWIQYMKTEGLIVHSKSFGGWTVDSGPLVWHDQDIWPKIQDYLDKGDVPNAAWLLRRYLEYTATILADQFRSQVEFKGDGRYGLADLMPHALKKWKKILEDGEKSATHWKLDKEKHSLATKRAKAKELIARTNAEQWAINPSVHFNEWANLQPHEFQEVVDAFKKLLESLRCENATCKSYLYIQPHRGKAEEIRCNCGVTNINLKM